MLINHFLVISRTWQSFNFAVPMSPDTKLKKEEDEDEED